MRLDPVEAARRFVEEHYPEATLAFVGGSPIRGDATATSDLDIVIVTKRPEAPLRASYLEHGWPIEAFVHTPASLPGWFQQDAERRRPSLPNMVAESITLLDRNGTAESVKAQARAILARGPQPLTLSEIEDWRYGLTDLLADFVGVTRHEEGVFVANDLAVEAANLTLRLNRHWLGTGKWVFRALARFDAELAHRLVAALDSYYRNDDKGPLIAIATEVLNSAGGRMFEGYYREAPK
jgi:hypothetical protein